MAAQELVLSLFDSYWFEQPLFTKKPPLLPLLHDDSETNPIHESHVQGNSSKPEVFSFLPTTRHVRSLSDHNLSSETSFTSDSFSPSSVPSPPKLQTVPSGEEIMEFEFREKVKHEEMMETLTLKKKVNGKRKSSAKRGLSKSLSDLEFEELKGFMDLGFVFSEEDKDSSLVSIIPGLQSLGRKVDREKIDEVQRPYLSEAWHTRKKEKENPLVNWRIPDLGSEMDMKAHLRSWAHTVASTVR
ncbi:hypothetical protein K2173_019875 [Erythroxylum novogranatense]|uniref:DUF1685 family protein n=1 Tax=Erythroxylum novogranatense TaxID=1862640 RepID=A0AAV8SMJ2_9ROSI|nr:hypothetical protein K2173_019875 [Erythroxylum novogranatense]